VSELGTFWKSPYPTGISFGLILEVNSRQRMNFLKVTVDLYSGDIQGTRAL
jgi:hypothetical protein